MRLSCGRRPSRLGALRRAPQDDGLRAFLIRFASDAPSILNHRRNLLTGQGRLSYFIRMANIYSHSEQMQADPISTPISQTLVHGFKVLQAFTAIEPALTLGQVASKAGVDSGTAFHLVQTLVVLGYVERISGSKQFRLTLKPLELGFHAIAQNPERFGIDKTTHNLNRCSLSELLENERSPSERRDKPK
jgi:DNA-binding MarR family transcriptional regulator